MAKRKRSTAALVGAGSLLDLAGRATYRAAKQRRDSPSDMESDMITIRTYKLPATDTRSARIRARYGTRLITREFPWESNDPHGDIAREMAERLYGKGVQVERVGDTPTGGQYVPVEGTYHV